ncbi:MerR family transcriptional regulator, partial [Enterococcus faecalis]
TKDLNWVYLVKNLRNAGLSIESLIEFSTLAQLRDKQNVEDAQKLILKVQLVELDKKLEEMQQTRELLVYKLETYEDDIATF